MEYYYFHNRQRPVTLESVDELPAEGFLWLDCVRDEGPDWAGEVKRLSGVEIHERHVKDGMNSEHPSYYDGAADYDLIVFRGLSPETDLDRHFESRSIVFFLLDRMLVTVRVPDSQSVALVKDRLQRKKGRIPLRPVGLVHLILSMIVDRFLLVREPLTQQLDEWRQNLLDPNHPFDDWLSLMDYRGRLRTLELLCEGQTDALEQWREHTDILIDEHLGIRYSDLFEHIQRVLRFAKDQQSEVESMVQLHFSAVAHRTNEIVKVLTILSAIFLPLTFIAGIYGMNFEIMPELKHPYGYFMILGFMASLAAVLIVLFKLKRWL